MKCLSLLALVLTVLTAASAQAEDDDAARGAELFPIRCGECHALAPTQDKKLGPSLIGLIGRTSGTLEGYSYSESMKAAGIVWSEETLKVYLANPRKVVPGTKMNFNGLKRDNELADVVAYLLQAAR